jgi:hypothetical protein
MAEMPNRSDVMTKFRRFAIAALAAATVTVGSLATVPTASALPMSCNTARTLARAYITTGDVLYALGSYSAASAWYGKAEGIMMAACG